MSEHELEKLIGGFAADTLTPEEREQLFTAALQDQQLFNALADEQALKDLLADPIVRRRLLQSLSQQQGAAPEQSWLNRFAQPAGLAWAGGVAVAVFAVVLGHRVYQDSLRQASETVALEEARPPAPSTAPPAAPPPQPPANHTELKKSKAAPRPEPATTEPVPGTPNIRQQAAVAQPRKEPEEVEKQEPSREKASQKPAPVVVPGPSREQPDSASDQPQALPSAPASGLDAQLLAQAGRRGSAGASARTLFYGDGDRAEELGLRSEKKEAETQRAQRREQFALQKTMDRTAPMKPLALRYSLIAEEREPNSKDASDHLRTVMLTVESNQDAYVQIWRRAADSLPELVLPAKETGRISLKTAAGQPQLLSIPRGTDRLIVRLSRVPFGPITRQEAVMVGHGSPHQLTESTLGTEEQATYVANPNLSAVDLAIEIPLGSSVAR